MMEIGINELDYEDDDIIESSDGYYPDVLYPTENGEVEFVEGRCRKNLQKSLKQRK